MGYRAVTSNFQSEDWQYADVDEAGFMINFNANLQSYGSRTMLPIQEDVYTATASWVTQVPMLGCCATVTCALATARRA